MQKGEPLGRNNKPEALGGRPTIGRNQSSDLDDHSCHGRCLMRNQSSGSGSRCLPKANLCEATSATSLGDPPLLSSGLFSRPTFEHTSDHL